MNDGYLDSYPMTGDVRTDRAYTNFETGVMFNSYDNAQFSDPVVRMGIGGVEYHGHTWEVGPRKAKEMLFTGDPISAQEAHRLGMVNHVVPPGELADATLALAIRIAKKPMFALRLAKEAVNTFEDAQGRKAAMMNAFHLHQLCHSHNMQVHELPIDPAYLRDGFGKSGDE